MDHPLNGHHLPHLARFQDHHHHHHYLDEHHAGDDASLDEFVDLDGGHEGFHGGVDEQGIERVSSRNQEGDGLN
jgi:hypothetical protein